MGLTVTESVSVKIARTINVYDSVGVTEDVSLTPLVLPGISVYDSIGLTEYVKGTFVHSIDVYDALTLSEALTVNPLAFPGISVHDSCSLTESIGRTLVNNINLSIGSARHIITFNGTAQLDTAVKKWGTASLLLDGDSDYLTVPDSADWDFFGSSTDNWTIDLWVRHTDHAGTEYYISQYEDVNNYAHFGHSHGNGLFLRCKTNGSNIINTAWGGEITDTDWHHVAFIKVGDKYAMYLDGSQTSYVADDSVDTFVGNLYVGQRGDSTWFFDGHTDEIRIQHSNVFGAAPVAGLTDTITVPTGAHNPSPTTKLLLHFDGSDGATATSDGSFCEGLTVSESVTTYIVPMPTQLIDVYDAVSLAEYINRKLTAYISESETISIAESVTGKTDPAGISVYDAIKILEGIYLNLWGERIKETDLWTERTKETDTWTERTKEDDTWDERENKEAN